MGIEQNFVTFVTNMFDCVKDTTMKIVAIEFKKILQGLQGRKCHYLIPVCVSIRLFCSSKSL